MRFDHGVKHGAANYCFIYSGELGAVYRGTLSPPNTRLQRKVAIRVVQGKNLIFGKVFASMCVLAL